jgi:hypothetical protein
MRSHSSRLGRARFVKPLPEMRRVIFIAAL